MRTFIGTHAPMHEGEGEVDLVDLVVHLGRTRRFGGWGSQEWTVLHHSVLVAFIWLKLGGAPSLVHTALLHDAHEAYTGDIQAPIKHGLTDGGTGLRAMEKGIDQRIRNHILPEPTTMTSQMRIARDVLDDVHASMLKRCDMLALLIEAHYFGPKNCKCLVDIPEPERAGYAHDLSRLFPSASHNDAMRDIFGDQSDEIRRDGLRSDRT